MKVSEHKALARKLMDQKMAQLNSVVSASEKGNAGEYKAAWNVSFLRLVDEINKLSIYMGELDDDED